MNGFRLNRRGRKPQRMRHFLKAEDSDASDIEEFNEFEEALDDGD